MEIRIRKRISSVLAFIVSVICIVMVGYNIFTIQASGYNKSTSKQLYKSGIDRTGIIRFEGENTADEKNDFWQEIVENTSISSSADFISIGVELDELAKIQGEHQDEPSYASTGWAEVTFVNKDIFDLCNIDLAKGSVNPNEYMLNDNEIGLYLGDKYKNKVKENETFEIGGITYKVLGFINKNQIIPSHRLQGFKIDSVSNVDKCDYKIIALKGKRDEKSLLGSVLLFSIKKDASFSEVKKEMSNIAKKRKIDVSIESIKSIIDNEKQKGIKDIFLMLAVTTVFIVITLYINLFGRIKNAEKYLYKNSRTIIISGLLALLLFLISGAILYGYFHIKMDIGSDQYWIAYTMQKVMIEKTFPIILLLIILGIILMFAGVRIYRWIISYYKIIHCIFVGIIVIGIGILAVKMGVNLGDETLAEYLFNRFIYVVSILGNIIMVLYLSVVPKDSIEIEKVKNEAVNQEK